MLYTPNIQINNTRYACINDLMRFFHFTSDKSILFVLSSRIIDGTIDTDSLLFQQYTSIYFVNHFTLSF